MVCRCGKEHNGVFGSLCEDCWADMEERHVCFRISPLAGNPNAAPGYKNEPDPWQHRTPRQLAKMGMAGS